MLLHAILNILLFIAGIICIFLVLANQNTESINDSSPINRVQSSQRDSIAVTIIQISIMIFLSLIILQNRVSQYEKKSIEEMIFQKESLKTENINSETTENSTQNLDKESNFE